MIKINLLPQKKARRSSGDTTANKQFAMGCGAVGAAALTVFLALDMPKRGRLGDLRKANQQLNGQIAEKNNKLVGYEELKKAAEQSQLRKESIKRLIATKVVPAHVLHELGKVLTREGPTMTEEMTMLTGNQAGSNPNKRFDTAWDPTHVWMTSFVDNNGQFRLDGGAQSESDVTQLSKRLAASVYFVDVTPSGGERISDRTTGVSFFRYTITGKVAY